MAKSSTPPSEHSQTSLPEEGSARGVVEKLVTFQSEREFDFFSGQLEERLFLKLYVAARTSGLLAEISDRDWKTLCVLATYMNAEGFCHPSQAELARSLGCSRQMANERVNHLAQFRFRGQPVLLIVKDERSTRGTWSKNRYQVLPLSQLSIFNGSSDETSADPPETPNPQSMSKSPDTPTTSTVSRKLDTVTALDGTVSSPTVTVRLDTNKNQRINKTFDPSNIRKGHIPLDTSATEDEGVLPQARSDTPNSSRMHPISELLPSSPPAKRPAAYDEVRGVIVAYLEDFARELNDQAPLTSSVTRAYRIYQRAGVDVPQFIAAMYAARSRTQEHSGAIRTVGKASGRPGKAKMAFWFACLEDCLGLKGGG